MIYAVGGMLYRYGGTEGLRYDIAPDAATRLTHYTTPTHEFEPWGPTPSASQPGRQNLASPGPNDAVATALDHVAVADADVVDDGGDLVFLGLGDSRAALPLPRLQLIVDLDHVLARRARDPPPVEHHARDPVVVRVRVEDRSRSQIPYLK